MHIALETQEPCFLTEQETRRTNLSSCDERQKVQKQIVERFTYHHTNPWSKYCFFSENQVEIIPPVFIGRSDKEMWNQYLPCLVVKDRYTWVSRKHCRIFIQGEKFMIEPIQSPTSGKVAHVSLTHRANRWFARRAEPQILERAEELKDRDVLAFADSNNSLEIRVRIYS